MKQKNRFFVLDLYFLNEQFPYLPFFFRVVTRSNFLKLFKLIYKHPIYLLSFYSDLLIAQQKYNFTANKFKVQIKFRGGPASLDALPGYATGLSDTPYNLLS